MAGPTSEKVGRGVCPFTGCGEPVTYRKSSGGKLTFRCDACDRSGYAEPGGTGYRDCLATIKGATAATPSPSPAGAPTPQPPAAPKARSFMDSL